MAKYQLYVDGEKTGYPENGDRDAVNFARAMATLKCAELRPSQQKLRTERCQNEKADFERLSDGSLKQFRLGFSLLLIPV